jgi:AcrR family transcriptional regulator
MPAAPCAPAESPRSAARRAQILGAARDCFRRHGFHGASIARICNEAGMSAGHIYHYFANKEAIIAAIVEQDLDRLLTVAAELGTASRGAVDDLAQAIGDCTVASVRDNLDPREASLQLEIVAEASRNPHVAGIVRAADQRGRSAMLETLRELRRSFGHDDDEARLQSLAELFATLFDGLLVRAVRNPDIDRETTVRLFRTLVLDLLRAGND